MAIPSTSTDVRQGASLPSRVVADGGATGLGAAACPDGANRGLRCQLTQRKLGVIAMFYARRTRAQRISERYQATDRELVRSARTGLWKDL